MAGDLLTLTPQKELTFTGRDFSQVQTQILKAQNNSNGKVGVGYVGGVGFCQVQLFRTSYWTETGFGIVSTKWRNDYVLPSSPSSQCQSHQIPATASSSSSSPSWNQSESPSVKTITRIMNGVFMLVQINIPIILFPQK